MKHDEPGPESPPIETRADGATAWSVALPLAAVSALALMLLHSCMRG